MARVRGNFLLSVIIPSYNEEERIGDTIRSIDAFLQEKPYKAEVIVVDDGSTDMTADKVRDRAGSIPYLKYMRFAKNLGKGWAVRAGMLHAQGRYRLFMDADGSTHIRHWDEMLAAFESGADIVVGSRHVKGSIILEKQSWHRETLGRAFRNIVQFLFRLPIKDTQNGFKAFTAEAAERVFRYQRVKGWAFDVEMLHLARKLVYEMREIPVVWADDDRSHMAFVAMPRMLFDIALIRFAGFTPVHAIKPLELPRWEIIPIRETQAA